MKQQLLAIGLAICLLQTACSGPDPKNLTLRHNLLSTFPAFSTNPLRVSHDPINLNSYDIYYKVTKGCEEAKDTVSEDATAVQQACLECMELSLPESYLEIQSIDYDATTSPKLNITGYLANADGTGERRFLYVELEGQDLQAQKMVYLNSGILDYNGWVAMRNFLNPRYRNPVFRIIIEAKAENGRINSLEVLLSLKLFGSTSSSECEAVNSPSDLQFLP